jgi:Tfp pilus assembly ATPase PilU
MELMQILQDAVRSGASDIFIIAGLPVSYKINGRIRQVQPDVLMPSQTERLIRGITSWPRNATSTASSRRETTTFPFRFAASRAFASTRTGSAAPWPPSCGL